jgi:hypothetical protein
MSTSPSCKQIYIEIFVNKKPILGLIDSGSGVTIRDIYVIGNNLELTVPVNKIIVAANGQKLYLQGNAEIELAIGT